MIALAIFPYWIRYIPNWETEILSLGEIYLDIWISESYIISFTFCGIFVELLSINEEIRTQNVGTDLKCKFRLLHRWCKVTYLFSNSQIFKKKSVHLPRQTDPRIDLFHKKRSFLQEHCPGECYTCMRIAWYDLLSYTLCPKFKE